MAKSHYAHVPDHLGTALGLRSAIYTDVFNENERSRIPPPDLLRAGEPVTAFGTLALFQLSLALLVELSLKGVLQRQRPLTKRDHTHNLRILFDRLPEDVRGCLDDRWQQLCRELGITTGSPTLPKLLQQHRNDLTVWRYFEPTTEGYEVSAEPLQLYLAASAILDGPGADSGRKA